MGLDSKDSWGQELLMISSDWFFLVLAAVVVHLPSMPCLSRVLRALTNTPLFDRLHVSALMLSTSQRNFFDES